jgi:formate dehydrogenase subunit gamma
MATRIVAFTRAQIWFHKHIIHFMVLFIITGLPLFSHAFSWLAWPFGMPLSALSDLQDKGEIIALGIRACRVVHWGAGVLFAITAIPFAVAMLTSEEPWAIWPEAVGLDAARDGVQQLKNRYLRYDDARMGKYNMGQKGLAWLVVVGVGVMIASGLLLMLRSLLPAGLMGAVRFLHDFFFIAMATALLVHVYLASHPINRAGLRAMFGDGELAAEEVKRHHPLWWEKLQKKGADR